MSKKKRTSLEAILTAAVGDDRPLAAPVALLAAADADGTGPLHESARRRTFEQRHKKLSAYLREPVHEQLRTLAFQERHKMHDYLIEGLDHVFRARGLPSISELLKEGA